MSEEEKSSCMMKVSRSCIKLCRKVTVLYQQKTFKAMTNIQAGIGTDDYRVEQLEADAVNLNTKFVYLLISITVELTWIWRGAGAREDEVAEAARVAKLMSPYTMAMIREGEEPIEFWTVLGGQDPYANDELDDKYRLFAIETGSDGAIEAVEVFDFEQSNLSDRRVAILDAGDTVYIWVGSRSVVTFPGFILKTFMTIKNQIQES